MAKQNLELKATSFTLSVLHINTSNLDIIAAELDNKLAQAPQFFLGAPLVLNLAAIKHSHIDFYALKQLLTDRNLIIVGITDANDEQIAHAKEMAIAVVAT